MSKIKITNVKQHTKDGKIYFSYDRETSKGIDHIEEPLYDEKGNLNVDLNNVLRYAQAHPVKEEVKEDVKAVETRKSTHDLNEEASLDDEHVSKLNVNNNWFKNNRAKIVKGAVAGLLIAATVLVGAKVYDSLKPNSVESQSIEQTEEDANSIVEGAVSYITYDDVINDCAEISKQISEMGYDEVSQRSLNSVYFITNYTKFEEDTVDQMIDNGVVSSDPMTVITDSLEMLSVCQDQTGKSLTGQDKEIIDLSMFCTEKEDKELLTHAYDSLNSMKAGDNENGKNEFMSYYHFLNNEETTEFPILYNEATDGANYLLNQGYGGAFCIGGSYNGIEDSYTTYLEEHTGMNDFSTVYKNLEKCLNVENQAETEITK